MDSDGQRNNIVSSLSLILIKSILVINSKFCKDSIRIISTLADDNYINKELNKEGYKIEKINKYIYSVAPIMYEKR